MADRVVRGIDCLVVLAEELLVLLFVEALRITNGSAGSSVGRASRDSAYGRPSPSQHG